MFNLLESDGSVSNSRLGEEDSVPFTTTNEVLKHALTSPDAFDNLYEGITRKIISGFEICPRPRAVMKLKSDIAILKLLRKNYLQSAQLFSEICYKFSAEKWVYIDYNLVEKLSECHRNLGDYPALCECLIYLITSPQVTTEPKYTTFVNELAKYSTQLDKRSFFF